MQARHRGFVAVSLGVAGTVCAWVLWTFGGVVATAVALGLLAAGLAVLFVREKRTSAVLERALGLESARARQISDEAWQSALLTQVVDELRGSSDETMMLETAATALARTLKASRAIIYARGGDGEFRVAAQYASEGIVELDPSSQLPQAIVSDRELVERLTVAEITIRDDKVEPELRAWAERLDVSSIVILPLGDDRRLAVHQCDRSRAWTSTERRFIQRFADRLRAALARVAETRQQRQAVEDNVGLVRAAHAMLSARDARTVLELATTMGGPLARARASAVVAEGDGGGFVVLAEHGFESGLGAAGARSLETALDDCLRARSAVKLHPSGIGTPFAGLASMGPVVLVPLYYGRDPQGVLVLARAAAEATWSDADVEVAKALGDLTAAGLENARLFESLGSADARYADLYDNARDLYQTIDVEGRILDCNRTECLTLGYDDDDLVGRWFADLIAPESVAVWRRVEKDLFVRGAVRDVSLKLRARDGRGVDVLVDASVVRASEARFVKSIDDGIRAHSARVGARPDSARAGTRPDSARAGTRPDSAREGARPHSAREGARPHSARVVMRNVTEQRRLEQQLRQRQKLEIVGALAGGIAHDFNNMLGGILGSASLLQSHLRDQPSARRFVETIERSAERGAELTGRLLSASRKAPARQEAVNLNEVVEETLELLAHTFTKSVRISKRLDSSVRPILADAGQLQQVVLNLCVNARDAMPRGGSLRVETDVDDDASRLRLSVEDTGVGMEPTTIERLFEPFFTTKGEGGSGLGLSVVYSIVKSLGGDVRVKSSPGEGARFDIFVPSQWVEVGDEPARISEPSHGRGELVLFVDDERVLREVGKEILESYGYRVQAVATGEDAVTFMRESNTPVALVILDLVMPGIDGGETYRRLRDVDTSVPVLLSSGLSSEEVAERIIADGATGFIPKPYGAGELTQAVSVAIGSADAPLLH